MPIFTHPRRMWDAPLVTAMSRRARGFARNHSATLIGLFSTSFFLNLANFGVSTLLVITTPASVFAAYLVGQSVVLLSGSLADGGLATAARIIASKERPDALLIATLQKALNRYAVLLAVLALIVIAVLAAAFSRLGPARGVHVPSSLLLLCAGIGIIQARQILCAGLIYSGGQFRPYSTALLVPAVMRLGWVLALVVTRVHITLPMLLANDLASGLGGWLYSGLWLRRLRAGVNGRGSAGSAPMLGEQVHRLLRSGMIPTFLEAVALQSVVLAGGAFGTGVAVATFGVFIRALQIIKVVVDPLLIYGERRLRLAAPAQRRRAEASFLGFIGGTYLLIASGILLVYIAASAIFHHYALGHAPELAFCLSSMLAAFLYLCLDSILLSRGYSNFRLTGTILQVTTALFLVAILHPASLWQLVFLNGTIAVPRFAFYVWFYSRRLSERTVWTLWVPEAGDAVVPTNPPGR